TRWQRALFPAIYRPKIRTIFDGIDTTVWRPQPGAPRRGGDWAGPEGGRVVTYGARGMEGIRGVGNFMKAAKIPCERRPDMVFFVVGEDRICYGGDAEFTGSKSFKDWVLARDSYDLSRIRFTGPLTIGALAQLLAVADLHIYLTVPFVLSWSLMNTLACGTTV